MNLIENIVEVILPDGKNAVKLRVYANIICPELGRRYRKAVIICPGGAYERLSNREADAVAVRFQAYGMQAFVLQYSVNQKYPAALVELAASMAYIRKHSGQFDIDQNSIYVCGFSAGGHLAASLGVHWKTEIFAKLSLSAEAIRPNGLILCYPLITTGTYTHEESVRNLLQEDNTAEKRTEISLEHDIGAQMPPTFLWHTVDDELVPVENSILLMNEMQKHKICYEAHILPQGGHGLALADECTAESESQINEHCAQWFEWAVQWMKSNGVSENGR